LLGACLLAASGCGGVEAAAMIEPRPATLTHASGCHTAPSEPRGWHYRGHLERSDRPILRTIPTSPIDRGTQLPLPPGATLEWAVIVANLVAFFLAMFFIGATSKKQRLRCAALAVVLGVLGMFLGMLGNSALLVLSVENATTMPVRVTANGMSVEVPPMSMTELRVGPSVDITTENAAVPAVQVEQLTLALEDSSFGALVRWILGDRGYVYSVCGANHFEVGLDAYR
jgi:hypothetical protein